MEVKDFLNDIFNRFPKYSLNRIYLERIIREGDYVTGKHIKQCAERHGLSLNDICSILDKKDAFSEEGKLNLNHLNDLAIATSEWRRNRDEYAKTHLYQKIRGKNSIRGEVLVISSMPKILENKMDLRSYTELISKPYEQILEMFVPEESMVRAYKKLFDKFFINYRVPEEVISAMIHFVLIEQKHWSIAYFEALASDLLTHRINSFDEALNHFQKRINLRV